MRTQTKDRLSGRNYCKRMDAEEIVRQYGEKADNYWKDSENILRLLDLLFLGIPPKDEIPS